MGCWRQLTLPPEMVFQKSASQRVMQGGEEPAGGNPEAGEMGEGTWRKVGRPLRGPGDQECWHGETFSGQPRATGGGVLNTRTLPTLPHYFFVKIQMASPKCSCNVSSEQRKTNDAPGGRVTWELREMAGPWGRSWG